MNFFTIEENNNLINLKKQIQKIRESFSCNIKISIDKNINIKEKNILFLLGYNLNNFLNVLNNNEDENYFINTQQIIENIIKNCEELNIHKELFTDLIFEKTIKINTPTINKINHWLIDNNMISDNENYVFTGHSFVYYNTDKEVSLNALYMAALYQNDEILKKLSKNIKFSNLEVLSDNPIYQDFLQNFLFSNSIIPEPYIKENSELYKEIENYNNYSVLYKNSSIFDKGVFLKKEDCCLTLKDYCLLFTFSNDNNVNNIKLMIKAYKEIGFLNQEKEKQLLLLIAHKYKDNYSTLIDLDWSLDNYKALKIVLDNQHIKLTDNKNCDFFISQKENITHLIKKREINFSKFIQSEFHKIFLMNTMFFNSPLKKQSDNFKNNQIKSIEVIFDILKDIKNTILEGWKTSGVEVTIEHYFKSIKNIQNDNIDKQEICLFMEKKLLELNNLNNINYENKNKIIKRL